MGSAGGSDDYIHASGSSHGTGQGHRFSSDVFGQFLCGFSMETEDLIENSRAKLEKKHLDLIAANNVKVEGAGFGTDTNVVTLITGEKTQRLEKMSKMDVAMRILDTLLELQKIK